MQSETREEIDNSTKTAWERKGVVSVQNYICGITEQMIDPRGQKLADPVRQVEICVPNMENCFLLSFVFKDWEIGKFNSE